MAESAWCLMVQFEPQDTAEEDVEDIVRHIKTQERVCGLSEPSKEGGEEEEEKEDEDKEETCM